VATLVAIVAAPEHEPQEAHGFLGVPPVVWQVLNLSLFLALLYVLLKKPAASFFGSRRREVDEANREADADRKRAEELAKEIDARLSGIETEIARLREHSASEAEAESRQLVAQAEADAQRIVQRGASEIEIRVREARKELTSYAGDLAVQMADDILRRSMTEEDQKRLVAEGTDALRSLAAVPGKGR
jgi:F-type H+-transporting ATPase subunit b